jgi:hypothetical protein
MRPSPDALARLLDFPAFRIVSQIYFHCLLLIQAVVFCCNSRTRTECSKGPTPELCLLCFLLQWMWNGRWNQHGWKLGKVLLCGSRCNLCNIFIRLFLGADLKKYLFCSLDISTCHAVENNLSLLQTIGSSSSGRPGFPCHKALPWLPFLA